MTELNESQIRALRWMHENPSWESEWMVDGKSIKRQPPEKWNQFKISGPTGSIIIPADDMKGLKDFIIGCPTPDKMYGPNEAGIAAISSRTPMESDHG